MSEEDARPATGGALACRGRWGRGLLRVADRAGVRCGQAAGGGGCQEGPEGNQGWAPGGTQDAIGADREAPPGPPMREEATDERVSGPCPALPGGAWALLEAEGEVAVCTLFNTVGGEGQASAGGGEGGEDRFPGTGWLAVGHPGLVPEVGWHVTP
jgi:hypothetical protein